MNPYTSTYNKIIGGISIRLINSIRIIVKIRTIWVVIYYFNTYIFPYLFVFIKISSITKF